jgi:hypothetical protein
MGTQSQKQSQSQSQTSGDDKLLTEKLREEFLGKRVVVHGAREGNAFKFGGTVQLTDADKVILKENRKLVKGNPIGQGANGQLIHQEEVYPAASTFLGNILVAEVWSVTWVEETVEEARKTLKGEDSLIKQPPPSTFIPR